MHTAILFSVALIVDVFRHRSLDRDGASFKQQLAWQRHTERAAAKYLLYGQLLWLKNRLSIQKERGATYHILNAGENFRMSLFTVDAFVRNQIGQATKETATDLKMKVHSFNFNIAKLRIEQTHLALQNQVAFLLEILANFVGTVLNALQ